MKAKPNTKQKTKQFILLTTSHTYRASAFVKAARRLNVDIVQGIDLHPDLADYWQVPLALQFNKPQQAVEKIVAYANKNLVCGVLAVDDNATIIAAMANEALGLPHNSSSSVKAARNKYKMRSVLAQNNVPCPYFSLHHTTDNPAKIGAIVPYPCVLKPLVLSGSRGVIRANNPTEFKQAFQWITKILATATEQTGSNKILVESFIPGVEVALEGILEHGKLTVLALFDKPDPLDGPFFEETIYITPSRLLPNVQAEIATCTQQAITALGLYHGPIHAELRVNADGPCILEIAARSIGGLCSKTLRFGIDISLEELILKQAMGFDIKSFTKQTQAEGVMMIPIPSTGILRGVTGLEKAKQVPTITNIEITAMTNHPLVPLPEGESYLGFIFAQGNKPQDVEAALREAHQHLEFDIAPMIPLMAG